ncbi:MAG: hypothetical protein N3E36_05495 [Sulfolobales archaeon]|nr:hypothetical protein [Sulfolobales archaeon]
MLLIVIVAIMPVIVMISTRHPFPLGDDIRFSGFAVAIENDGRWISYKYRENPYYQFFHLIPVLEYVLASVTGVGVSNVMSYYLTLKIAFYLTYFLFIFLVMEKLLKDSTAPFIAVLLSAITPPMALTQVVHQCYAIVLFMVSAFLELNLYKRSGTSSRVSILTRCPLWLAGIVAHATFALMLLAFIIPLALADKSMDVKRKALRTAGFIFIISLTYWMYTYVLDIIVRPTVNAFERFTELFTGEAAPWYGAAQPWYTPETSTFFIAWALVPSIVASYILLFISPLIFKSRQLSIDAGFILGFIGLAGTAINYALRTLPTFGGRYFYWLYLLMLPTSALVIRSVSRKFISSILAITLISIVSFYGIQDPSISANTYGVYIGWANMDSWSIAKKISSLLPSHVVLIGDPRIENPLAYVRFYANITIIYPSIGEVPQVLIVGKDWIGFRTITGAESWYRINLLIEQERNVVLMFNSYVTYYYPSN